MPDAAIAPAARDEAAAAFRPSTPCLTVDLDLLDANIAWLARHASRHGVNLRPHAKTHKCSAIARRQVDAGALGVCCATIDEAEVMAAAGIPGVVVTSPLVGEDKLARFADLVERARDARTVVDDADAAQALSETLARRGLRAGVLIDIDVGQHRTGTAPAGAGPLAARVAPMPGLRLDGLQAYAGNIQHIVDADERERAAAAVHSIVRGLRKELAHLLPSEPIVSGGGTGTHAFDAGAGVFTELQAGSYIFMDADYGGVQPAHAAAWPFGASLLLHTTVVSAPVAGEVTTDAGTKAFALNGPAPRVVTPGYGDVRYEFSGDEHGRVVVPASVAPPRIGARLACVVSHCDPTVALHDRIYGMRDGVVVETLPIDARGRR